MEVAGQRLLHLIADFSDVGIVAGDQIDLDADLLVDRRHDEQLGGDSRR